MSVKMVDAVDGRTVFDQTSPMEVEPLGGLQNDLGFLVSISFTKELTGQEMHTGTYSGTGVTRRQFRFMVTVTLDVNGQSVTLVPTNQNTPGKYPGIVWWHDTNGDHYELGWI